jgi:hypothetical protein
MDLPRIFIEVTGPDRPDGACAVTVTPAKEGSPALASYDVGSIEIEVNNRALRVPIVPPERRQVLGGRLDALCAGDAGELVPLFTRLAAQRMKGNDALVYGRWLFECLLAPAWTRLCADPEVTAAHGFELALVWSADHADLHSQVWEGMYVDDQHPLAGLDDLLVVVTRVVRVEYVEPDTIEQLPRVLFASGAPLTDEAIRPGAMFVGLLRKFDAEGICVTRAVENVTLTELQQHCQAFHPDVVHLVAHGETLPGGEGRLLLGSKRAGDGIGADQLLRALKCDGAAPMSIVLSACHSGGGPASLAAPGAGELDDAGDANGDRSLSWRPAPLAAQLVAGGIPIVTAMAGAVSEPACRMFTTRLIDAIHQGKPLGQAAAEGRAAALTWTGKPAKELDWAMPTIFLASSVKPDFRPLDPAAVNRLSTIAASLKLRKTPVFIGRQNILDGVDGLFPEGTGTPTGFVAVCNQGSLSKLGSTRLLQEMGFRLLRAGHVPLLLADYPPVGFGNDADSVPRTLRAVVAGIFQQAIRMVDKFDLRPPKLSALGSDPACAGHPAVTGAGLASADPGQARQAARLALVSFRGHGQELVPDLVKAPLAADLAELAGIMAGAGEPFGSHTRVVVLADQVHLWTGALSPLLKMVEEEGTGLGSLRSPVPVVVTASLTGLEGPALQYFLDRNLGTLWLKQHELTPLSNEEAALGFQWVLLSQWHPDPDYHLVFAAARDTSQELARKILSVLSGKPASVREALYQVVQSHVWSGQFVTHDDDRAFAQYTRLHQ